ncbi:glutamine synthetase [Clostridium sp.]|uniref:glutamine synthetase n=1 Tax=Clostridium sp. TaxID=1506 RepID=UPI002FC87046
MHYDLLYVIKNDKHNKKDLLNLLNDHEEIKFVSLVGIDFLGNDTDEKIPTQNFIENINTFLHGTAIQTDGSSVVLPGIASLNNAKVDMKIDLECNWFVDYNFENLDSKSGRPVGTLRIPCHLYHENLPVDSRHILKNSVEYFNNTVLQLLKENPEYLNNAQLSFEDIDKVSITAATELEFWVKTPNEFAEVEELSTSEVLKEQYWKRTKGVVRTALEKSLIMLENYGLEPEMGHKEVGGVKAKLTEGGSFNHIMEQLEIDWKYSTAIQACDNELLAREIIKETFRKNGLDVTFQAKPIDEIAGNGKHLHVGVILKLKNGKVINLFHSHKNDYLSEVGYGALMGILKNYEVINPFVSSTNGAFRRLRPGFEAPVCIVTSLGHTKDQPSRNRTILIGLIRDLENPMATRFELRSPNPHTNIYLALATMNLAMVDGIKYAIENNKSCDELLKELSKSPNEDAQYLEHSRCYRSEEDVFEHYTEEERENFFGRAPMTVYENIVGFENTNKLLVLEEGKVFSSKIINSYKIAILTRWVTEIEHRLIPNYMNEIRNTVKLQCEDIMEYDLEKWMEINKIRETIMKDSHIRKSLFTRMREAISNEDYKTLSDLQINLDSEMKRLRKLYLNYRRNLLNI